MPDDDRYPTMPVDLHGRISRHAQSGAGPKQVVLAAVAHELVDGHAVLAAQHLLDRVLATCTATFGLYTATPAGQVFTDLAVLASQILRTTATTRPAGQSALPQKYRRIRNRSTTN